MRTMELVVDPTTSTPVLLVVAGTNGPQSAVLTLDIDGSHHTRQATGNGPVDATFNAIHEMIPHKAKLELYQVHAVTEGTDAQAEVSVRLADEDGKLVTGRAADPDTMVASAKAYIAALNKLQRPGVASGERVHATTVLHNPCGHGVLPVRIR
ncbi:MAG: hypothetical protein J5W83_13525 [Candidatus Accumulibacter sp.]|nr:hypothetical protein [Accumulibacter sp.]